MKIIFLGTGASPGVPMLGCGCKVCRSHNPKNKRLRASILIQENGFNLLVDTSTDLRAQCLAHNISHIDAALFTHHHADHILGLEELRAFNHFSKTVIPCYGSAPTLSGIKKMFHYIFNGAPSYAGLVSQVKLYPVGSEPFFAGGMGITPLDIKHGDMTITGYKFNNAAYVTDCSEIPAESMKKLEGLDLLILNALRYDPHPTHFNLDAALGAVEALKPKRAILTHMAHQMDAEETGKVLPEHVELAYDGLVVEW